MKGTQKPVIPRALARLDTEDAVSYYRHENASQAALGFVGALQLAYTHIGRYPASGSSRHAHELGLPGLLCWPLKHYPYQVFYVEQAAHVEVLRVLHEMRDITRWLGKGST